MQASIYAAIREALDQRRAVAVVTLLGAEGLGRQMLIEQTGDSSAPAKGVIGTLEDPELDRTARELVDQQWLSMSPKRVKLDGGHELFIDVIPPPPKLVIVGAVHVAIVLVRMAKEVGFECLVVDPRTAFATQERFGHADALIHEWPDEALEKIGIDTNTFVVLLSHDLKLDVPALQVSLHKARYIGALGSRKTHQKRLARLREAGVDEALFPRMHNPVGLDLGGRRAEEMAVSILAQIVAVNHGHDARPLP